MNKYGKVKRTAQARDFTELIQCYVRCLDDYQHPQLSRQRSSLSSNLQSKYAGGQEKNIPYYGLYKTGRGNKPQD